MEERGHLYLPEIKTDSTEIVVAVDGVIGSVFWVVDFWVDPLSFVSWVLDVLWLPLAWGKVRIGWKWYFIPLYSGLSTIGGSHSPSISSSQSSGMEASGSAMCSGFSQSSGLVSSGSAISSRSSHSI